MDGVFGISLPVKFTIASGAAVARSLTAFDLDADGDSDLVYINSPSYDLVVRLNNGNGTFAAEQLLAPIPFTPYQMISEDVDRDEDYDLLVTGATTLLLENISGAFPIDRQFTSLPRWIYDPGFADIDGDGDFDLTGGYPGRLIWAESYFESPFQASGSLYFDVDTDGNWDPGEPAAGNIQVGSTPTTGVSISNASGEYRLWMDSGAYVIQPTAPYNFWGVTSDSSEYSIVLNAASPASSGLDFGIGPVVDTTLFDITHVSTSEVCGGSGRQVISIANQGTTENEIVVELELDPIIQYTTATPQPDSVVGNSYYWGIDTLKMFGFRSIEIDVVQPTAAFIGDTIVDHLTVSALDSIGMIESVVERDRVEVVSCAYDPNDKLVTPLGYGQYGAVDIDTEYLYYTVRFMNTGTDTARTVMLRDQLAPEISPNSTVLLGYSHDVTYTISQYGELVFRFDDIALPDSGANFEGSQGFVSFRVSLLPGLSHLTEVENCAAIHFDLNAPIITNTTLNTLVDCDLWAPTISVPVNNLLKAPDGDSYQWYLNSALLSGETSQHLVIAGPGLYEVEVTSHYGCTALSAPYQVVVTSVMDLSDNVAVAVVPNPLMTNARILFSEALSSNARLDIVDINGRVVRRLAGNGKKEILLERDGLAGGVYLLRIQQANGAGAYTRFVIH